MPLSTLRLSPRDERRKTRGQDGSLLLSCRTLSFPTACRFIPALRHYGLANRRAIEKIATARSPVTRTERGVSNREGDTSISASRLSARNRFLLHCHRPPRLRLGYGLQCGATPKLTMIAGARQFSIRTLSVRKLLLNPTIPDENAESSGQSAKNAWKACK